MSSGLISTSTWESGPIVVLEALSQGVPVVCTPTGHNPYLSPKLQGLFVVKKTTVSCFKEAIEKAGTLSSEESAKEQRALLNRPLLLRGRSGENTALIAVKNSKQHQMPVFFRFSHEKRRGR